MFHHITNTRAFAILEFLAWKESGVTLEARSLESLTIQVPFDITFGRANWSGVGKLKLTLGNTLFAKFGVLQ